MKASARLQSVRESVFDLAARMPGSSTALSLYDRDRRYGGSVLAAGLAFRLFLMLLPFALLLAAGLGFLAAGSTRSVADASRTVGITGVVVGAVSDTGGESRDGRWLLLVLGFVLLLNTLNGVYRALVTVHAVAWHEEKIRRASLASRVVVSVVVILLFVVGAFTSWLRTRLPLLGPVIEVGLFAAAGAAWLLVSVLLPHRDASWYALVPGALAMAVGLAVLHAVTVYYVPHKISSTSHLYGSLGAAAALMGWLFLSCRLIVGAAALNASLWERGIVLGGRWIEPRG